MKKTITQIAKEIGVSQGFLSNILAGRRRPRYSKAKVIASLTGTTVDLWMEGSPDQIRQALGKKNKAA